MQRWWLQLHAVFEMNRQDTDEEINVATTQVITGLHHILREQLNRRFALGVTLCKANFRVWLCDRSGLVGMRKSINMHSVCFIIIRRLTRGHAHINLYRTRGNSFGSWLRSLSCDRRR